MVWQVPSWCGKPQNGSDILNSVRWCCLAANGNLASRRKWSCWNEVIFGDNIAGSLIVVANSKTNHGTSVCLTYLSLGEGWVAHLLRIREVPNSNFGPETGGHGCLFFFCLFFPSVSYIFMVEQNMPSTVIGLDIAGIELSTCALLVTHTSRQCCAM